MPGETAVERTERQHEALSPLSREVIAAATSALSVQETPQLERSFRTCRKTRVERDERRGRTPLGHPGHQHERQTLAGMVDENATAFARDPLLVQDESVDGFPVIEILRGGCEKNDPRVALRRPDDRNFIGASLGIDRERASPSVEQKALPWKQDAERPCDNRVGKRDCAARIPRRDRQVRDLKRRRKRSVTANRIQLASTVSVRHAKNALTRTGAIQSPNAKWRFRESPV